MNVFDPAVHKSSVAAEAGTFVADQIPLAHVGVANEVVKSSDGITTYVKGTDYTIDYPSGAITRLSTGSIAAAASIKTSYDWAEVSKVVSDDIIGGIDAGTGLRTGLELIDEVFTRFGVVVGTVK